MMNRLRATWLLVALSACGGKSDAIGENGDGGGGGAATSATALIGHPCVPAEENDPTYTGAREEEVSLESPSPQCGGGVCLSNHFRGRVTCPYGQDQSGAAFPGASACTTPDGKPVTGTVPPTGASVSPQCTDRLAANTVTCSCRCANAAGRTDDGKSYCDCAAGTVCTQLVTSIGAASDDVSGAYCIKAGTQDDRATDCSSTCDPKVAPCP